MNPFDRFGVGLAIHKLTSASDGLGGWSAQWKDGDAFVGAVSTDQSIQARIAEADKGVANITLSLPLDVTVENGVIVHNLETNDYYKVEGIPDRTPTFSRMDFISVPARSITKPK